MSLAITLTNALSGLMVNQTSLQVTANNVANVNTEGYSRKTVTTESRTLAGVGAGVVISSIDRAVDKFLQGEVRTEATALGEREVRRDFYLQMQALFGNLNDDNSVGATITRFATSLENVATNPDSAVHRLDAVTAGAAAARELNALAQSVQDLRGEADRKIAAAVDDINDQLSFIAELNVKIANNRLAGNPTADLEDQRALAIDTVAEYLPIQYFERSNGYIVVMTRNGQTLVESQATRIGYSASTVMTAERTYLPPGDPGYPGTIAGIIVNPSDPPNPVSDGSRDITLSIGGGRLASLIEMRDTTLVDMADQFDELAAQLRDRVNALHNQGTPYPGSTVMTGTVMLPLGAATPVSATGYVRIGTVDASGNMNVPRLDLDLGTVATVADIVTAINSTAGLNVTAAVDGQGRLVLTSGSGDELVVAQPEPPSALAPSAIGLAGGTRGFSHFFGLNNFFTATPELGGYSSGVINPATRADSAGTLTFQTPGGTFAAAYANGMSLQQVADTINAALAGQGVTAAVDQVTGGARLQITGPDGTDIVLTDSGTLLQTLGVRPSVAGAARSIGVRQAILESPDLLSRGKLREEPAGSGNFYIGSADDAIARAMADAFATNVSFGTLGGLPATDTSLAGYGAAILSFNASNAETAERDFIFQDSLHRDLKDKALSFSGVNLDEEMSNMVVYQNAYQASARLVQAVDELFTILVNLGR